MPSNTSTIAWFSELSLADLDQVGGKNASLGEMIRNLTSAGVRVPMASRQPRMPTASSSKTAAWPKQTTHN
jgi:hypothetical protein